MHVDLDAARDTKTYDTLNQRVLSDGNMQAKFNQIEQLSGMKIPDDMHDVTLYGKEAGDAAGVVLVHAKIDRNKTQSNLQQFAQQYASNPYGSYDVLTWFDTDKNQTMYGAFHDDSNFVIAHNEKNVELALDAIDGKAESLKADSPLLGGAKPQVLVYVAAKDMPQLHGEDAKPNPVLKAVQSAWISFSEKDDMVTLRAELQGSSADTAANIRQTLLGVKSMISLAVQGDNPDPVAKAVVAATNGFTATQQDKAVEVEWPIPVEQAESIINAIADKQAQK